MAIKSELCTIHSSRGDSASAPLCRRGYGISSLFKACAPHLNNIPNNSCLTRTALNKKEYRVIVQLEEKVSEGQKQNRVKKVGEAEERENR